MLPYESATVFFESWPLMETQTALGAGGTFPVNVSLIDTIDFLPERHSNQGLEGAGAMLYNRDAPIADARFVVDFSIHAQSAGGLQAPGVLVIHSAVIDPATGLLGIVGSHAGIQYQGPPTLITGGPNVVAFPMFLTGSFRVRSRFIGLQYVNGATVQTVFRFGAYMRTV